MAPGKILIITYYWPPSGGVGVQRWMNLTLQLKERGWDPMVLTPSNPQFELKDEKLLDRVKSLKVYKVPIWEPFQLFHKLTGNKEKQNVKQGLVMEKSRKSVKDKLSVWIRGNLFIPDPRVFWVKAASDFAIELIKKEAIPTVITTGPPHSIHLVGRRIKKKTGVNWVADFRDPWSKWDILEKLNTSELAMYVHRTLETSVLRQADKVITVSDRLAQSLGGVEVINNGVSLQNPSQLDSDLKSFTIGYFGMLNELRDPKQFWMMLDQMCRENVDFASKLKVKIGGIVAESIKGGLSRFHELNTKVEFLGYLSHEEVQDEYRKCDLLLLLLNKSPNSKWILPVKFFEYLAANRLILGMGQKESDLGDIMNKVDVGELFPYKDIQGIRSYVEDVFENNRKPLEADVANLLSRFSHKKLVEKLDRLLMELNES